MVFVFEYCPKVGIFPTEMCETLTHTFHSHFTLYFIAYRRNMVRPAAQGGKGRTPRHCNVNLTED